MLKRNTLWLLSLLVSYIVLIIVLNKPIEGDALRYIKYATNMAQGFYTDANDPDLSNGPGYPIVLLPFVAAGSSLLLPKILNGIFVFLGIFYFYKSSCFYIKSKYALIAALVLGLYPPLLRWMPVLYSESLSFFLINGAIFHFCSLYHKSKNWQNCIMASFFLGCLILTKVIFFHVVALSVVLLAGIFIFKKKKDMKWPLFTMVGAVIFTLPYLLFTYSITNKPLYLGTRGGELLYHRSTPFQNEYGNWFSPDRILGVDLEKDSEEYLRFKELRSNHGELYRRIQPLSNMEKDSVLKSKAYENMKEYPIKYLKNTVASTGRLFFGIPNSYSGQTIGSLGYIIPNGIILVLLIVIARPVFIERKKIPFEIIAIFTFALIYGFGVILLIGKARYFIMMVPSIMLTVAYVLGKIVKIDSNGFRIQM